MPARCWCRFPVTLVSEAPVDVRPVRRLRLRHSRKDPMRRSLYAAVISVAFLAACSNSDLLAPVPAASKVASNVLLAFNADQPVRISEFHYDNAGDTDFNEWFEISAPGGTSLQGYTIVLYRGSDGMSYGTRFLGSVVNASCNG